MNKKGGKVLGKGRDGCVIDPPILCSTKSNKSQYNNQVSKLIDISGVPEYQISEFVEEFVSGDIFLKHDPNGENFLPGLEMCYKKYHQLNKDQKKDIKECKYNESPYESTYINILLKKGFSFQKTTQKLNNDDFLRSLAYLLLGAKRCIHNLNILLLDVKADNLLYSEDKGGKFPVFIDFSNDFVITNRERLFRFLRGFQSYYDTWTLEIMIFFISILKSQKNPSPSVKKEINKIIRKLIKDIKQERNFDLNNSKNKLYASGLTKDILLKVLYNKSKSETQQKNLKEFYEKQMCYAIGKIYTKEYDEKIQKKSSFKNVKIEFILDNLVNEGYYDRFMIDNALTHIYKLVNLRERKDYLIRNRTHPRRWQNLRIQQQSLSPAILASLNNLLSNMQLTPPISIPKVWVGENGDIRKSKNGQILGWATTDGTMFGDLLPFKKNKMQKDPRIPSSMPSLHNPPPGLPSPSNPPSPSFSHFPLSASSRHIREQNRSNFNRNAQSHLARLQELIGPANSPSPPQRPGWVNPKKLKKKKNKKRSISYDLKDVTPNKLKKMKKPALIKLLKKYKENNCKKITGLKKDEMIDRILLFQPELEKKDLKSEKKLTLQKILKTHINTKCQVKPGDKKKVLHDFILKNII